MHYERPHTNPIYTAIEKKIVMKMVKYYYVVIVCGCARVYVLRRRKYGIKN